jgi:protein SCO1/2
VRARLALLLLGALAVTSCDGIREMTGFGDDEERMLTGYRRDPAPVVAELSLPDLSNGGEEFTIRADPGEILLVYFGYTNCPDFCPTTLSDVRLAEQRIDEPERVDVAMVGVDPDRDLDILAEYLGGFFDDGHALATDDPAALAQVAAPFGVQYEITENDEGEIEVAHTTGLYAVDDQGALTLTWPFGVEPDDLAADFEQLLEAQENRV